MNFEKMFHTIDTHVAGEAFRIVTQSPITFERNDVQSNHLELQHYFSNEKNLLLNEPRGHRGMHGCIVLPSEIADICLLFFHHKNVSTFKYEGVIAVVTALLETGNLKPKEGDIYKVETVNGVYTVKTTIENNEVCSIYLESRQCDVVKTSQDYHTVRVDGERNYAIFALPDSISGIELKNLAQLNQWGREKTAELSNGDYDGIILVEENTDSQDHVRSITFERDGYILRSPGIDSTFAIMSALLNENREITNLTNTSIFGSSFSVHRLSDKVSHYGLETEAYVTGAHQFIFDQDDPLKGGFLLA